jgi:hypothetical protein
LVLSEEKCTKWQVVEEINEGRKQNSLIFSKYLLSKNAEELLSSFAGKVLLQIIFFEPPKMQEDIDYLLVAVETDQVQIIEGF